MYGIVYRNSDHQVLAIVSDVLKYATTEIIGADASVKGIDLSLASFCIVDSTTLQVGDTLGQITDTRNSLPPTLEERLQAAEDALTALLGL